MRSQYVGGSALTWRSALRMAACHRREWVLGGGSSDYPGWLDLKTEVRLVEEEGEESRS